MNYRAKSITVDVIQWHKNGDHPDDYTNEHEGLENGAMRIFTPEERKANEWEGDIVRYYRHPHIPGATRCTRCGIEMLRHGWIDEREGIVVCPGDFILTYSDGTHERCNSDHLHRHFEPTE